jgi:hypothetical protein
MPLELRDRPTLKPAGDLDPLEVVRQALARIRYGAVHLTVHDGRLVQIDITEKRRFEG